MDYSPLIGGFSITLNDGRAAYLTASNLKFDPNVSFHVAHCTENQKNFQNKNPFTASTRNLGSKFR